VSPRAQLVVLVNETNGDGDVTLAFGSVLSVAGIRVFLVWNGRSLAAGG